MPCLPNVYQKRRGTLVLQGFRVFPFFGCLPNVYQNNFFTIKQAVFACFQVEILTFFAMQGALYWSKRLGKFPKTRIPGLKAWKVVRKVTY